MLDFFIGIKFEYPLVFLVLILYLDMCIWCKAKNIGIYFQIYNGRRGQQGR